MQIYSDIKFKRIWILFNIPVTLSRCPCSTSTSLNRSLLQT